MYILATIGFAGSLVFYDALLPHVAKEEEIDQVSSRDYAMGYVGGGVTSAHQCIDDFLWAGTITADAGSRSNPADDAAFAGFGSDLVGCFFDSDFQRR